MVSISFYGGVNEIGGNKILVEDKDTKIFLDFGMSFGARGDFFEEFLSPRTANGIGDFLEMGLLPDLEGIYREDLMKHIGRKPLPAEIDGVLVSHAHADHVNYISFLHEDIPIYCGETAHRLLNAIQEQSNRGIENEVINFRKRPIQRGEPPVERKFNTFRTGDKFKIGSIEVEPIHVDHSVPGAYGYLLHTTGGTVIYTGDLRLHGNSPEMTYDFVNRASDEKAEVLISEGTRIDIEKDNSSEKTVYQKSKAETENAKGLIIADFNFKDIDRFRTFYQISKEIGRKLVIGFKHACFLEQYHQDKGLDAPDSRDENIFIFKQKRMTGTYDDSDYRDAYIKNRLDYPNLLTAEDIRKNEDDYMVILNYYYFNNLVDLKPTKGSTYIHSTSEAFNEEMELTEEKQNNWLNHFGLRKVQAHCSGHASGSDIKELISKVKPKTILPIHTEHPEIFKKLSSNVKVLGYAKPYKMG
ncbi:MBL fold metallo-hydrolase [Candidatus Undinarchaeota archaeon]